MATKREQIESYVLKLMSEFDKSGKNVERYKSFFKAMDQKAFDNYMKALRDGKTQLSIQMPNSTIDLTLDDVIALAEKRKTPVFQKVRYHDPSSGRSYLTKHPMLILNMPVRRLSQYLHHKISLPEGDRHVNPITGQVIPPDKGSALSMVETQVLVSKGLETSIYELVKTRSGDINAYRSMKHEIEESGEVSIKDIQTTGRPRSSVSIKNYLHGMMIDTNL